MSIKYKILLNCVCDWSLSLINIFTLTYAAVQELNCQLIQLKLYKLNYSVVCTGLHIEIFSIKL